MGRFSLTAPTANPQAVSQVFTLANVGTAPGAPPPVSVSGDAEGYTLAVDAPACAASLPVGGACAATVTATFTGDVPALAGVLAAGPLSQPLAGSAIGFGPLLSLSMGAMASGWDISSSPFSRSGTFTVSNVGLQTSAPVSTAAFAIAPTGPVLASIVPGGTCVGQTLPSGGSCTIAVEITGTDNGPYAATVSTALHGGASGAISGSVSNYTILNLVISSNTNNYNIRAAADAAGWTTGRPVAVTVQSGVVVGSTNIAVPALQTGSFPVGTPLSLTNNGTIVGRGGPGGNYVTTTVGLPGGPALRADVALTVSNAGLIGGGGGGGGRGHHSLNAHGSGGGGGAGAIAGEGGPGVAAGGGTCGAFAGQPGTLTAGGAGGPSAGCGGGMGGNGGSLGQPGTAGQTTSSNGTINPATAGGAAGAAAVGNALITWQAVGDRRGPLVP